MISAVQDRRKAAVFAILAVGIASMQDAVVKAVSNDIPASEAVTVRALASLPLLFGWLWLRERQSRLWPPQAGLILLRSVLLCAGYFCFILSIAALPIATSVSIYFTMPFFVAALAPMMLGEQVRAYRWIAITAGFAGVLVMVRPGADAFEPAALLALSSAFLYAVGQIIGRRVSQTATPAVIAIWQTLVYLGAALALVAVAPLFSTTVGDSKVLGFLFRSWQMPDATQLTLLIIMGAMATIAAVAFILAYKHADANFVAPFEYTALLWAVVNGALFFGDWPDVFTLAGAAIVIGAGLWMLRRDFLVGVSNAPN